MTQAESPDVTPSSPALPPAVRALYPFRSRYLDLGGLRYHYLDEGRGEPVLMVHGNPTWSFYFRHLVSELRADHRTIVPDHIGCGLSDKPGDDRYPFTLARRVDDLERLVEHLDLRNLTLVVHDWGGMIGTAFAVRQPERVKRLVVANTAAFPLPPGKRFPLALRLCRTAPVGPLLVRGLGAFNRGAAWTCVKRRPLSGAVRAGYLAPYGSWASRRAVLRFVQDIPLAPGDPSWRVVAETEANLGRLAAKPLLILWGARDFVFDDHFLDGWRQRFPKAEVHRFADAGHYVFEDAADESGALIRAFLERHP